MALLTYSGLAAVIIMKDLINTPEFALALIAPLVAMSTWDKLKGTK